MDKNSKSSKVIAVLVILLLGGLIAYVTKTLDIVAGFMIALIMIGTLVAVIIPNTEESPEEDVWRDGMINLTGNPHITKLKRLRDDFWQSDEGIVIREQFIEFLDED